MALPLLFLLAAAIAVAGQAVPCVQRDYGKIGTVCVCNATYCDKSAPIPSLSDGQYALYTSSLSGLRFEQTVHDFLDDSNDVATIFTITESTEYQRVEGFGGAFTDSAGINIASLSAETQGKLLEAYFAPGGNAYTLGRVPIGGSDFSTRPYTYADENNDTSLPDFKLAQEDTLYKIPYIQKAIEIRGEPIRLLAAAWSAPPWMKTNNNFSGVGHLKEEYYAVWSDYHLRFLEEYGKSNIQIWLLSTGNEPLNGDIPLFPFNCMGWTPKNQVIWVNQHIGPALESSPFNQTLLMAYDDQRFDLPAWLKQLFGDEEARSRLVGVGVHWYWDKLAPLAFLDKVHEAYPEKFILGTEASYTDKAIDAKAEEGGVVHLGSWQRGQVYAEDILDDMNHWVSGWVDWNLALDETGGPNWAGNVVDAPIIVNATADEFYKQPMFYAIGHFSKFVPTGSVRVDLTGATDDIKGIAFKTPQNLTVIVLINKNESELAVNVNGIRNGTASFVVPGKSLTTFLSTSASK